MLKPALTIHDRLVHNFSLLARGDMICRPKVRPNRRGLLLFDLGREGKEVSYNTKSPAEHVPYPIRKIPLQGKSIKLTQVWRSSRLAMR
jgi:hypothetical protein